MSLRDRAKEILAQGAEERKQWTPKADSGPVKVYQFWAKRRPKKVPKRENFCHYWRVVLFAGPFWFVFGPLIDFLKTRAGMYLTIALLSLSVFGTLAAFGGTNGLIVLWWIGFGLWVLAGFVVGFVRYGNEKDSPSSIPDPSKKMMNWITPSWVFYYLAKVVRKIPDRAFELVLFAMSGAVFLFAAGGLVYLAIRDPKGFFLALAGVVTAVLLIFALVFGLSFISDAIKSHHRKAVDSRTTYEVTDFGYGYKSTKAVVAPSRTARFFMGIGDFINVLVQAVRVKKWKICPIVEIPSNEL